MEFKGKLPQILAILAAIAIVFLIIRPFIGAIAFAALIAYLSYPLYKKLREKINKDLSALLITTGALVVTVLTAYYGITIILNEFSNIYIHMVDLPLETMAPLAENIMRQFLNKSINSLSDALYTLPQLGLSFLIFFISLFYLLKDGKKVAKWALNLIPFKEAKKHVIGRSIIRHIDAFVHVQLVIGLLQGVIAGIGFYLFGLPYPLLAGIAACILSILPVIGPYLLYIPTGILAALQGNGWVGIGILIYGLVLASILDYIVRPYLIGKKAQVHPIIIFVGILGGLQLLGVIGIFVGPILLSVAIIIIEEVYSGLAPKA